MYAESVCIDSVRAGPHGTGMFANPVVIVGLEGHKDSSGSNGGQHGEAR